MLIYSNHPLLVAGNSPFSAGNVKNVVDLLKKEEIFEKVYATTIIEKED